MERQVASINCAGVTTDSKTNQMLEFHQSQSRNSLYLTAWNYLSDKDKQHKHDAEVHFSDSKFENVKLSSLIGHIPHSAESRIISCIFKKTTNKKTLIVCVCVERTNLLYRLRSYSWVKLGIITWKSVAPLVAIRRTTIFGASTWALFSRALFCSVVQICGLNVAATHEAQTGLPLLQIDY